VRTLLLRPTWHVVAAADLRWLLALTAPRVHAVNRYRYTKVGLDETVLARSVSVLDRAVADGEAHTRAELGAALAAAGIAPGRLGVTYLMMHAELEALICSGPRRGKQQTYMSVDARVPPAPALDREEALAELLSRYLRSRAPATVKDDLTIGYRVLRVVLPQPPPRGGLLERPILVDGATIGSWKRTLTPARSVTVEATAIEAEVARFGRFLDRSVRLVATTA
jgi:hypothetical protein